MNYSSSSKGSTATIVLVAVIIIAVVIIAGFYFFMNRATPATVPPTTPPVSATPDTYGMSQYADATYGFSFWYPSGLAVTSSATDDSASFPGGIAVETLQIGSAGGATVTVVNSPTSTITDEPANHANPINQTKYTYDSATSQWIVSYPQGPNGPGSGAPAPADVSKTTMSGLIMLPSGKRFDTTIIPLTTTEFLVVSDGGGSSFTSQLAATVAPANASVPAATQASALQAESDAASSQ